MRVPHGQLGSSRERDHRVRIGQRNSLRIFSTRPTSCQAYVLASDLQSNFDERGTPGPNAREDSDSDNGRIPFSVFVPFLKTDPQAHSQHLGGLGGAPLLFVTTPRVVGKPKGLHRDRDGLRARNAAIPVISGTFHLV